MNKLLVGAILLICLAGSIVGYASYMIYSNILTVNVSQYTLTLTSDTTNVNLYELVTLTATLDLNGSPASGRTVVFYQGQDQLGTDLTDEFGIASWVWNATNVGAIEFRAGYQV